VELVSQVLASFGIALLREGDASELAVADFNLRLFGLS
jgi:hypothetical protein